MMWSEIIRYAHRIERTHPSQLTPAEAKVFWDNEARYSHQSEFVIRTVLSLKDRPQ